MADESTSDLLPDESLLVSQPDPSLDATEAERPRETRLIGGSTDWLGKLSGYELRLWGYVHSCSRLTLKAIDAIAKRPSALLVFHDVTYIEMPLTTGQIKAREGTLDEYHHVESMIGPNYRASNVVAFSGTDKRTFLIEYGFVQWLKLG